MRTDRRRGKGRWGILGVNVVYRPRKATSNETTGLGEGPVKDLVTFLFRYLPSSYVPVSPTVLGTSRYRGLVRSTLPVRWATTKGMEGVFPAEALRFVVRVSGGTSRRGPVGVLERKTMKFTTIT